MTLEERVRDALAQEAARRDVDVDALYVGTRARLTSASALRDRRLVWPSIAVAALVLVLVGAVTVFVKDGPSDRGVVAHRGSSHVAATFRCPVQGTTRFNARNTDDSFLPELTDQRRPAGEAAGVPRYQVLAHGSRVLLRVGNADGSLASVVTFRRTDGAQRYVPVKVVKCTNVGSAKASRTVEPLVTPGVPRSPSDFTAADFPSGAVLVADRVTYDVTGLVKPQAIWAYPCDGTVCLRSGSRTTTQVTSRLPPQGAPQDHTSQLTDPDDVVGQRPAHRLYVLYDGGSRVSTVSWTDTRGRTRSVPPVKGGGWEGQLFLALVPAATFATLTVTPRQGPGGGRTYRAQQMPAR